MKKQTYQKPDVYIEQLGLDAVLVSLPDNLGEWIWEDEDSQEVIL